MNTQETSERYGIPLHILEEYESWGLCGEGKKGMGAWQYDDRDLERLSIIAALHDIGFDPSEVADYMRLLLSKTDTCSQRMAMLNRRRSDTLDEIHFRERQLERLDYLRYKMQANQKIRRDDKYRSHTEPVKQKTIDKPNRRNQSWHSNP